MYPNVIGKNTKTGKELNKINKIALNIAISIKGVGEGGGGGGKSDVTPAHFLMKT